MRAAKKNIYISIAVSIMVILLPFIFPVFTSTVAESATAKINLEPGTKASVNQFITVKLKANNTIGADFPKGTAVLSWEEENSLAVQKFDIHIDDLSHSYYVPTGENPYWQQSENISSISLNLPEVRGIDFKIEKFELDRRILPPLDSYINSYFKQLWSLDYINRFLVPSYIILGLAALLTAIYYAAFRPNPRFNLVVVISLAMLVLFSLGFLTTQIFTAKSYWLSYRQNIEQRDLASTYQGFYDFEKFISWVDQALPPEQDLAVLVKGQPVYIMSEMAYNLYPRDIKFIDISDKNNTQVIEEIDNASKQGYNYIVVLSAEDSPQSSRLNLIGSYREEAGLIYTYNKE